MNFKFIKGWHLIYNVFGIKLKKPIKPMHYHRLNLVFPDKYGISNRLLGFINYVNYTNPEIVNIYWDNTGWVSSKFKDIFKYDSDLKIYEYNNPKDIKGWKNKFHGTDSELTVTYPPVDLKTLEGKVLLYPNISEEEFDTYSKEFKKLLPSAKVTKRIKEVVLPKGFVALQVRNAKDWDTYGRSETLDTFFKEIDKFPEDTIFYLSAMDKKISDTFKERYHGRILELPSKNYQSMIDAVADLYIMSYAKQAIYSYGSTFGELAFWLSTEKQKVNLVGKNKSWM